MPNSITYGSYNFPEPLPTLGESDTPIVVAGKYDHKSISISLIGFITGSNLRELHEQKESMISGFLTEYQDLTVTIDSDVRTFNKCLINSLQFNDSDLTTVLPYSAEISTYEDETFSEYFGVESPENNWSYQELDGKIIQATHTVSAKGVKVDSNSCLTNARNFVTANIGDFEFIGLFNSGDAGFLTSRTEDVNRKDNTYGVTEVYSYSTSDDIMSDKGVLSASTDIQYSRQGDLSVSVKGTLQGDIDAYIRDEGLTTGDFTPENATHIALNSVVNSSSNYEQEVYTFLSGGATSFDYTLDTGANKLDFVFNFENSENLDFISGTNVLHNYDVTVNCTKDNPVSSVAIQGSLKYHAADLNIASVGDAGIENPRFKAVSGAFDFFTGHSGIYNLSIGALDDFSDVAVGYDFTSTYLRKEPTSMTIKKDPSKNIISYNYSYNNSIDYSTGRLNDFTATITNKVPIQKNSVRETVNGYNASLIIRRTLGEYSISASANNSEEDLNNLKSLVSDLCSGEDKISDSHAINPNNITYNLSKYY